MGRTHESVEQWEFPEGTNVWEAVRAADAYVRLRVGLDKSYQAGVFDGRGRIFEDDLNKAYAGWQEQSSPLKGVVVSYGDTTENLHARVHAMNLDAESDDSVWRPRLEVTVNGADAAAVRGIALEAIEHAQRGLITPSIEVSEIVRPERPPSAAISKAPEHVSRVRTIVHHPWVLGIAGMIIAAVIAGLILAWILQ